MLLSYASWSFRARAFRPIFGAPAEQPWLSNSPLDAIYVIRNDAAQDVVDIVAIQMHERDSALIVGEHERSLVVPVQRRIIEVRSQYMQDAGYRSDPISVIRHDAQQWPGELSAMQVFYDASAIDITNAEYSEIVTENIRLIEVPKENRTILIDSVERAAIIA